MAKQNSQNCFIAVQIPAWRKFRDAGQERDASAKGKRHAGDPNKKARNTGAALHGQEKSKRSVSRAGYAKRAAASQKGRDRAGCWLKRGGLLYWLSELEPGRRSR